MTSKHLGQLILLGLVITSIFGYAIFRVFGGTSISLTLTSNASLKNGLVGHWTFDAKDISGTTISDRSGQGNNGTKFGTTTETFTTAGATVFQVPPGITSITIKAWGGGGGGGAGGSSGIGGDGAGAGFATGVISVTPGESLNIYVGGAGITGEPNGGGGGGGGGGGRSEVARSSTSLVVASGAGGGGGGDNSSATAGGVGGVGGGTSGGNAGASSAAGGGTGGTSSAGGSAGTGGENSGTDGVSLVGGEGGNGGGGGSGTGAGGAGGTQGGGNGGLGDPGAYGAGGGGGGGYYGGGGGSSALAGDAGGGGGGGGSSYIVGTATGASTSSGSGTSAGNNGDSDYGGSAGQGGGGGALDTSGGNGVAGRVVVSYIAPAVASGRLGQALEFDGVDDYVGVNTGMVGNNTAFTVATWFKTTNAAKQRLYFESDGAANTTMYLSQNENVTGDIEFCLIDDVAAFGCQSTGNINLNDGAWHYVVGVQRSKSDRELFVDGASQGANTGTVGTLTLTKRRIGAKTNDLDFFKGSLDDVRVYNRALSASEVGRLYNMGATTHIDKTLTTNPALESGLVGHWTFDGPNIADTVGESFDSSTFPPTTSCDSSSWTTGGNANWARNAGTFNTSPASAASGAIGDNQSTWVDCNVTLSAPATLSFSWKVSSENTYDFLMFCYDNDSCTLASGYDQRISGEVGFTTVTKAMTAGAHSLRWVYAKDANSIGGTDTGWVDDIKIQKAIDRSTQGNAGGFNYGPTGAPGRIGQALSFDGIQSSVQVAHNTVYDSTNLTISVWVKPRAIRTSCCNHDIVSKAENDDSNGYFLQLAFDNGGADAKKFIFDLAASGGVVQLTDTTEALPGEWYHVVATLAGTSAKLYVNGSERASNTVTRASTTHDLEIGSEDNGGACCVFDGTIDDVRLYNRALSASEVGRLYNLGATTHIDKTLTTNPALESGLVGHWTYDGSNMYSNVGDRSGRNNNGNLSGQASTTTVPGRIGQALYFDGVNDFVKVPSSTNFDFASTGGFSYFTWFKKDDICNSAEGTTEVFTSRFGSDHAVRTWWFGCSYSGGPGKLTIDVMQDAVGNEGVATSTSAINDGAWHHGGWVYDGSANQVRLYLDGVLQGTAATVFTGSFNVGNPICLGSYGTNCNGKLDDGGAYEYRGILDDSRVYNRALSAAEITRLYNLGR